MIIINNGGIKYIKKNKSKNIQIPRHPRKHSDDEKKSRNVNFMAARVHVRAWTSAWGSCLPWPISASINRTLPLPYSEKRVRAKSLCACVWERGRGRESGKEGRAKERERNKGVRRRKREGVGVSPYVRI